MKVIDIHIIKYNEKYCKVYQCYNSKYFLEHFIGTKAVIIPLSETKFHQLQN